MASLEEEKEKKPVAKPAGKKPLPKDKGYAKPKPKDPGYAKPAPKQTAEEMGKALANKMNQRTSYKKGG